jgi:hypothetical protein
MRSLTLRKRKRGVKGRFKNQSPKRHYLYLSKERIIHNLLTGAEVLSAPIITG